MNERLCSIEGCDRRHSARGWCATHYHRWWKHGDPLTLLRGPHVTQHGTINEYQNYGCRCDECTRANSEYQARCRKTRKCSKCDAPIWQREGATVTGLCAKCLGESRRIAGHGTHGAYKRGCHCDECRAVATATRRAHRAANREASRAYDRAYKRRVRAAA